MVIDSGLLAKLAPLVDASRSMLMDAYDHQAITFGELLRALPLPRDRSRLPLMSVMFNIDQALDRAVQA